jgi:hypothetical protein
MMPQKLNITGKIKLIVINNHVNNILQVILFQG